MRLARYAVILSALAVPLFAAGRAGAQAPTGVVTGRVTDSTARAPLTGARVSIVGTSRATVTRDDGTYILVGVPEGTHRVRSTVIGYAASEQSVSVRAGQSSSANFTLHRTAVALSEVVVVGYGAQRRSDLTGAISSVPTEELLKNSAASVEQGLQGRVAGVQVTQGDAAPGGAISVQIRGISSTSGSNQPLYVIDGVPVGSDNLSKMQLGGSEPSFTTMTTTNPMSTLASSDIESIDVLKDASATAIYGSRGANGVVIITTKRGHSGKGQFNVAFNSGISQVVRQVDVLDAKTYAEYSNVATKNAGRTDCPYGCGTGVNGPGLSPDSIGKLFGAGINWQDRIFHDAPTRDLQLGFTGGDDLGGFAVTSNYYDQQGAIIGSGFRRGGARMNVNRQLTPVFHIQSNLAGTRSASKLVRTSGTEGTVAQGIVRSAIRYSPLPVEALDSARAGADARAENLAYFNRFGANPTRYTDEVKESETETRVIGSVRLGIKLPMSLNFESSVGGNYTAR
ncbi:MAG: TonB-dependent receptor plug domain-containing protein, partial [Gemmatimonadaceae bacterium]